MECKARAFACSWCPFRDYCEEKSGEKSRTMKNDFDNDVINAETWYLVYIYDGNESDKIIEDVKIQGIKAAEEYGKKRKAELGKGFWYHVKVD